MCVCVCGGGGTFRCPSEFGSTLKGKIIAPIVPRNTYIWRLRVYLILAILAVKTISPPILYAELKRSSDKKGRI